MAIAAINNMKTIFYSNLSIEIKARAFECYISSVFLYNCELWTLSSKATERIDSFQRKLLRTAVLNTKWPNIAKNVEVYESTKAEPWSRTICKRQLSWFGHLTRLPDDTPAKKAFAYAQLARARPRGRPSLTWLAMMKKRILEHGLVWEEACTLARDRIAWKDFTKRCFA